MTDQKKILVVDDDPDQLEQVTILLKGSGYEVVAAPSRAEAEELLLLHHPDLAVLDLMMEEMDSGFVLCHEVKRLYPGTPVILLTAVAAATGMDLRDGATGARSWVGADLLLDKPVRPEQLRLQVSRLLEAR
ncbi:MAG: response regulator [Polyangia bacterium]|jgi:CheY-like chemotaxis protein|nr:response regulator [Polyangia bacterium]